MHVHRSFYDTGNSVTKQHRDLQVQGSTCSLLVEDMLHGSQDQGQILDFLYLVQVQFLTLFFFKLIPRPFHGVSIIWRIGWNDHQAITI